MSQEIISIHREKLPTWGYKYTACMANGIQLVLRKQATRSYSFAAMHVYREASKFALDDVRGLFSFHNSNPRSARNPITKTYLIQEA